MRYHALTISLLAALVASCQPSERPAYRTVFLRASSSTSGERDRIYEIRLPSQYLASSNDTQSQAAVPGATLLTVWAMYPGMEGESPANSGQLRGEHQPNKSVLIGVEVSADALPADWGLQVYQAKRAISADAPDYIERRGDEAPGILEFVYPHKAGMPRAAFIFGESGSAFVDCSYGRICQARRSFGAHMTARYFFDGTQIVDFKALDQKVVQLLESFDYKQVSGKP